MTFSLLGYIDPGSGTLLLQAALAAGLASIVCLRWQGSSAPSWDERPPSRRAGTDPVRT